MKKHTKIYFETFGYGYSDFIPCEICRTKAVDIHHIDARGMGGTDKDKIDNLMALCRKCHDFYGDKKQYKDMLRREHQKNLEWLS